MAHGYKFYESSLSHLVDSLVQLPDVPWKQIQRIIALCPRVDMSPCTVSLRQHIAVCASASYLTRSGGSHHDKLGIYFISLVKCIPKLHWNLSKNQIKLEEEYVAFLLCSKICNTLLQVNQNKEQVYSSLTECIQTLLGTVLNIDLVKEGDSEKLLNFSAPSLLGLIDGMGKYLQDNPGSVCEQIISLTTSSLLNLLRSDEFTILADTWLSISRSHPPHPMETLPHKLLNKLLQLFRTQIDSIEDKDLLLSIFTAIQAFIDVENARMYPKFKQQNIVSRSSCVSTAAISALCECLDVTTLLITETFVYQHYQKLNNLFNTSVNLKTPDLLRVPLRVSCVKNIGLLTNRFPLFVDDAMEIYKQMLFGPSTNLSLLHIASCLEPVSRSTADHQSSNFQAISLLRFVHTKIKVPQRTAYMRRSNRPKAENVYTTSLDTLRKAIISSLISVISAVHETNHQLCQGFLSSASNQLLIIGDQDNQLVISNNAVRVLGAIATNLSDFETVKMVIQIFRHKICNPPSHLDTQMIKQLGDILLYGNDKSYSEVLSLFMHISSKAFPESKSNKDTSEHHGFRHCSFTVIRTLEKVCSKLDNPQRLQDLIPWLLEVFVQRSLEMQKVCEREKSTLKDQAGNLGVLLPVFAILMGRIKRVETVNTRVQRLFRDFWQICVVMNFVTRGLGQYTEEWYAGVEAVACKTPLMSSMGADTFLQHDLQYNSALKLEGIAQEGEFRVAISEHLHAPELNAIIYRMNYGQCTFFLSAYHIELMRVSQPNYTCYHLFHYLQDKGIQKDKSGIYSCFEHMCTHMFQLHIDHVTQQSRDEGRQAHLENLVQFLLVKFNHCVKRIRLTADKWLSKLIDKFNHLLWSEEVLKCLTHLTQELVKAVKNTTSEQGIIREVSVPYEPGTMNIAEENQERQNMLNDFSKRFAAILKESVKFAPLEKLEKLQDYEDQLKSSIKGLNISLEDMNIPMDRKMEHKLYYNASLNSATNRSKFYGHIEGMKSLVTFQGADFDFVGMVLKKMEQALTEWKQNPTGSIEAIEAAVNHTAAFLICEEKLNRKALRALCWVPVTCFTKESVRIAANCWEWTVSKRPEFETQLLMENIAAWKWTVNHRIGLFSPTVPCKRPVVTDNKLQELSSLAPNCEPHRLWIRFLTQRFEVIKYKSAKQVELFTSLFHTTLPLTAHNTSILSNHVSAIGPRFEFLHLGLLLLQNDIISNELNQSILRERLYTAILDYFCVPTQWPCYTTAECLTDVGVLNKFWDTLFHDKKYLKSILVPTTISPDSIQMTNGMLGPNMYNIDGTNSPSSRSRSLSVERSKANSVVMKKTSKISEGARTMPRSSSMGVDLIKLSFHNSLSKSASFGSLRRPVEPLIEGAGPTLMGDYKSKYHLKKRNLILFLIHHEIERLYTWAQPLSDSAPSDEKKTNFVYKNFSEKSWNDYMHLAWTCHPKVALSLALRVRSSDSIYRSIRLFVKSAPANFYDCVEALPFIATPQNVKHDLPQLVHMLAWTPASPLEVLTYFSKEYQENPITGMYALQSIQSYPCETLLFLVPQIVQAIRHDAYGYVRQIIYWIATLSPIVTHQVIWNMKTNMFLDEEAEQIDPIIGSTLNEYIQDIKSTMSGSFLEFYNREFDFFDSVTEVSSIIKPYPKGPERNAECLRALKDIKPNRFGTYLPSNPDSVIIGIDYTSGKPMQSAAKAPFLATFIVKDCPVTEMQSFDAKKANLHVGVTRKSCIFKEGDDLRQDILALQIIEFFLKAFQSIGMEVYLKPYRVVATAPGSGVIEVVPDSKTRDELGKKTDETLYHHFIKTYGDENSVGFQNARENFVKSMAGYSIVTWLLQIKDRHNGNIMISNTGHIIHIDFGFLFESSPGGNMGFEPDIKLTEEMIQIMGGSESAPFKRFSELVVRGFLAVRPYCEAICTLVSLMMGTNLPCFRDDALRKLRNRFQPHFSDRDAANHAKKMIRDNLLNKRTVIYDKIQYYQNEIAH
ncbi:phosphatidylinositol 4-kinase alpha-like isoform X6 [Bolinopsis microptera]|uniref:phosphatidylinositol 4-kinase alpha-like isoform X6 n=1 Tax=Bolinopsis microptera TaxID=2820187 RepID=UPI00307A8A84